MDPFLGFIGAFGFNFAPRDWAICAGTIMSISQNQALYSLLGTFYGGDGRTTYGLPDLRGRAAIAFGQGHGLPNFNIGQKFGSLQTNLDIAHMPQHTHAAQVVSHSFSVSSTLEASTENGDHDVPQSGDFLATSFKARGDLNKNYISEGSAGTTVPLGGLDVQCSSGAATVVVGETGSGAAFWIMQPVQAINYCIAMQGIYPPRN